MFKWLRKKLYSLTAISSPFLHIRSPIKSVGNLPSTWRKGGSGWLLSPGIPGRKFLLVENVCVRGKTSSSPPALAQRMNQNRYPRDKTPGEPRPPSYQAEVFNPFVGQPAPPGHSHAAGPAAPRSPPASPTSSGGRRGSGYSGACGLRGGQGGDGGSKTEWKPGAGAAPGRAGYALRYRVSRAPRTRPSRGLRCALRPPGPPAPSARSPAARVRPAEPAPLSGGEPVAVAAAVQDVLG